MTLIVLVVLAAAWLGYFALWFREKRTSGLRRSDGLVDVGRSFSGSAVAAGRDRAPLTGFGAVAGLGAGAGFGAGGGLGPWSLQDLLEPPRSRRQALRRRRRVAAVLLAAALVSLLAVPVVGSVALAVHVIVDLVLVLFAFGSLNRQPNPAATLAEVRVLYPDRPAPSEAAAVPLRPVANG